LTRTGTHAVPRHGFQGTPPFDIIHGIPECIWDTGRIIATLVVRGQKVDLLVQLNAKVPMAIRKRDLNVGTAPDAKPLTLFEIARRHNEALPEPVSRRPERKPALLFTGSADQPTCSWEQTRSGWLLSMSEGVTPGLIASNGLAASKKTKAHAGGHSPFNKPKGTPMIYHPNVVGPDAPQIIRRKNGRRVRLHVVFNGDDRQVFNPGDDYPWRCVGKLLVWKNPGAFFWDTPDKTGTAALVGPNFVVTSAHMVPPDQERWKAIFLPGLFDENRSFGEFSYMQTWRLYKDYDQGSDLAILKLYDPIGERLGWFGTKTYDSSWQDGNYWTKVGYASMIANGNRPNRVMNFPIIDDDDSYGVELEYQADGSPGDSGGPVFSWWDDGPYIVGVHSGEELETDLLAFGRFFAVLNNVAAGGAALPDLVNWGHANW